jgi:D-alanyl-lipoteichoic acid acyltransferase DltB (MBOAT superfamily)
MGFDSLGYLFFLYGLVCLFRFWRASPTLLLAASLVFYAGFDWRHFAVLLPLAALTYAGGLSLSRTKGPWRLAGLLTLVFLPLATYKIGAAAGFGWAFPLGISFFTFHCASYLVDCYRGTVSPEPSARNVLLYVAFFPQLVAGPITRAREMLPQFRALRAPDARTARRSACRIYLGFLKKFAIANVVGVFAKEVLAHPTIYHGYVVLLAVFCGRYFIYADFSGYTDIAIGSARLLGVELPENFRRPFAALSIADYWRRWHITLSSWIRDYVFFPLAASPLGAAGPYPLVVITFLVLGAWHGLSVNFLLYGLWHGTFLVLHDATRGPRQRLWKRLGIHDGLVPNWAFSWFTFVAIVCPPTILFLTAHPGDALAVVHGFAQTSGRTFVRGVRWYHLVSAQVSIALLEGYQWLSERVDCFEKLEKLPRALRWLGVLLALAWLGFAGEFAADLGFLYFQF